MYSPHSPALSSTFGDHRSFVSSNNNGHHLHQNTYQYQQHSPNSLNSSGHNNNINSSHHHIHNNNNNNNNNHRHHHQRHDPNGGHFNHSPYSASFSTTLTSNSTSRHTTNGSNMAASHHLATLANTHLSGHNYLAKSGSSIQCLRFKYFTTFFVCTTCLVLLSASLATHKWLVSKPIRQLRQINGQRTNLTALMLTLDRQEDDNDHQQTSSMMMMTRSQNHHHHHNHNHQAAAQVLASANQEPSQQKGEISSGQTTVMPSNQKFQGEIYFGLFNGVKVLNYGFGDRVSQLSVVQAYFGSAAQKQELSGLANGQQLAQAEPLINFKFWLVTLMGVLLGIVLALVGSIFAIINFVMTPRGTMSGPVGLVIWNAAACFSCLLAIFAWLAEYYLRLKSNVLTHEEIQNGWTSENRSQFGYSYYFVVLAFCLHLVNIFIVSIVQSETWTNSASCSKAAKRQARSACDGVIMLY